MGITYRSALYRQAIYRGPITTGQADLVEVGELEVEVIIYNGSGVIQSRHYNYSAGSDILGLDFEMTPEGPGQANLTLAVEDANISYDSRVEVRLYGTTRVWYAGFIDKLPELDQRTGPYKYHASGYFTLLKRTIIREASYTNTTVIGILQGLMATMTAQAGFDVNYNPAKVSPNTYLIPAIKFKACTLHSALTQLADLAKNHQVGVDVDRDLFFLPTCMSVRPTLIFVEGVDYKSADVRPDASKLVNRVYPKIGKITSGSNVQDPVEDSASITAYGLREKIVDAPSVFESNAELLNRWAAGYLLNNSSPLVVGTVRRVRQRWNKVMECNGQLRLLQSDGTKIEGYVKKVKYTIRQTLDIEIQVGRPENSLVTEFVEISRTADLMASLADMNAEQ